MNKILVIDDEEWLREMVRVALKHKGFEVAEADNGAQGIELARKLLPDIILCDVNMAQVDGYLTLSSLRNEPETAAIPFILMTGLADQDGMRHGMELGADDYLPKPFSLDALFAAVDARLKKAQMVRREAEKKLADLRSNITMMLPHELRTPLNGLIAYGEILANGGAALPAEEVVEMGKVIYDSGRRLQRLVENFLIYAQIELLATDPSRVYALRSCLTESAHCVVERECLRQAEMAERTADLTLDLVPARVDMTEEYLSRVVGELVQNAFKFSQPGQKVSVMLRSSPEGVMFHVEDQGNGFSPEHITRVGAYMQFNRKLHEQQGLGLGLTIARRLVELHGGSLSIESSPAVRTIVSVKLPKRLNGH